MNIKELRKLAEAVESAPLAHRIDAFARAANPQTLLALLDLVDEMASLLPQETNGSFISLGKYYAEHMNTFAPPSDPMSKFKIKWFMDCVQEMDKYKELTK